MSLRYYDQLVTMEAKLPITEDQVQTYFLFTLFGFVSKI